MDIEPSHRRRASSRSLPAGPWAHVPWSSTTAVPFGDTRLTPAERAAGVVADASGVVRVVPGARSEPTTTAGVQAALAAARRAGMRVTIAGTRHSGGGQALRDGELLLDMRHMDGMRYDPATGSIDVQPGATWEQVQRYLDQVGRAVAIQQSSNVFSVGGSIATNIHGRDVRFGPLVDSIESVRVVLADGREVEASRTVNPDLFRLVVGGYGQVGVVTQARLRTVPNEVYEHRSKRIARRDLVATLARIATDPDARLLQVRLPVDERSRFDEAYAIEYRVGGAHGAPTPMQPPHPNPVLDAASRGLFRLAIGSELGKRMLWWLQTSFEGTLLSHSLSRNQAMAPAAEFLRSNSTHHRQVLQEYFVPLDRLDGYLDQLERVVGAHHANLLNITLRLTPPQHTATALPYAPGYRVAAVLYLDQREGAQAQAAMDAFTRDAAQAAVDAGGSFYLPYQLSAFTDAQLGAAYPGLADFFAQVHRWDPGDLFHSAFDDLDPARRHGAAAPSDPRTIAPADVR